MASWAGALHSVLCVEALVVVYVFFEMLQRFPAPFEVMAALAVAG